MASFIQKKQLAIWCLLEAMLQKLEHAGLKIKLSKCGLFHKQITYQGHIISTQGISTNLRKTKVIKKWPTLTTITDVRSVLGFTSSYHQFIPNFVQTTQPFHELTAGKNVSEKKALIH